MSGKLIQILHRLNEAEVEYILVGGMAAVLHGAPVATQDLDIVHRRTRTNVARLLAVLADLHARYRGQPEGRIRQPSQRALSGTGHNNLITALGPLDILCELAPGQGYDELIPHAQPLVSGPLTLQLLSLKKLIEVKAELGRPKDLLMIPILMKLDESGR